ncbi:hypothetical protein [Parahaliea mediterranea]|uniref:Uncharacterized protein n=1 Tax=Parahaliea mediterranea TaxID=651086 RepID=A0A939DGV3_9GAMM|nr:hypothetical protein [Parahaliea mediterranea]MBN7798065.1 hypothetical protein [Parahaliea mediterranea]
MALARTAASQTGEVDRGTLELRELGSAYAHLISFAAEPEISASRFSIDNDSNGAIDQDIDVIKLPLYREFELEGRRSKAYLQAAFSALSYTEEGRVDFPALALPPVELDAEWQAYSAVIEAGLVMPLGGGFFLAPGLGLGGTRIDNETTITGEPLGPALEALLSGVVIDWQSSAYIGRANIGLLYREKWGSIKVRGAAHFVYSYVESFNESKGFAPFDAHNGSVSVKLDLAKPLAIKIGDDPLYLIGHGAATSFVGAPREVLNFDHFFELGASLGYRQVALGIQAVLGPDVDGLSIVFDYGF